MFKLTSVLVVLSILSTYSCTSLNGGQNRELKEWQAKNVAVQDKNPATAAALNVLPGIGDFYNGNVGLGVVNLLTWPASILWAPVGGATGADEVNYYSSKANIEKLEGNRKKLKNEIETVFIGNQITKQEYVLANKKVDSMDISEFTKKLDVTDVIKLNYDADRVPSSSK